MFVAYLWQLIDGEYEVEFARRDLEPLKSPDYHGLSSSQPPANDPARESLPLRILNEARRKSAGLILLCDEDSIATGDCVEIVSIIGLPLPERTRIGYAFNRCLN
jgi:hypothetical protein